MISKKKATIGAIILALVTSVSTFTVSNIVQIPLNQKVLVNKAKFDEVMDVYESQSKAVALEEYINQNYIEDVEKQKLEDGQLKGLFEAIGDPYSTYMNEEEFASFAEHTKGTFGGIGVVVSLDEEDNRLTVERTVKGGPSEDKGIKRGDKIVKVDGKEYKPQDYSNAILMREDIVKALRGKPGTKVKVTLLRKNEKNKDELIDKEVKREEIRSETVESKIIDDNIGYISIDSFDEITAEDFKKELAALKKQNIEALILDLRFNPGGVLDVSTQIADEFMGEGTIVYTEDKQKKRNYIKSDKNKLGLPLAVLVNGESASASEVVSGALQDSGDGVIVGTKTFGKGIVQTVKPLSDGSGVKLTISEYFTPKGRTIHDKGVEPDVVVELPEDIEQIGPENLEEDTQLKKALEIVKDKLK